ncbi:MAG: HDIG domain-containing protein [Anaerosomatales bacterium]|nr:HDIG domain-containing protein [Anaerosomatales bacterium]
MPSLLERVKGLWPTTGWLSTVPGQRVALGVAVIILAVVPIAVRVVPIGLEVGQPAPRTFRATRPIQYVDTEATQALREAAREGVNPVYQFDQDAQTEVRRDVVEFFSSALSVQASLDTSAQVEYLLDRYGSRVDTPTVEALVSLDTTATEAAARNTESLVAGVMASRIQENDLEQARNQLAQSAELIPMSLGQRYVVIGVGTAFIEPTLVLDQEATEQAREAAAERVSPVVTLVQEGENIVAKGEIVTERDVEMVRSLGGLERGVDLQSVVASMVLMAMLIFTTGGFIYRFEEHVWLRMRDLLIIAALLLGMMYLTRGTSLLAPELSPYLMPVPLAPILATLLVGPVAGVIITVLTTIGGLLLGFSGGVQVVATVLASLAAIVVVANINQRSHLFYAGGYVIALQGVVSFGTSLASGNAIQQALGAGLYGLLGGLVTAVLTLGLLPFFEHIFGVTTDIRLLELGNPGHPLLRRLMTEAPGTYNHSVMTGNLAETAAEAIGANPLLARVGSYFHDVGKLRRPAFFVENQAGGVNPHDTTSPTLSALIITAHVREGLELAKEYRLPREITDIIIEHHGTSMVSYFYNKAAESGGAVHERDFRYSGRRPSSPEAALIMLADSVEAAVRALGKPTPQHIEDTVRKIVKGKIEDHQLDDAHLTLADIERIVQVYTRMLASVYHPRIEYPEPPARRDPDARQRNEPSRT